MSARIHTATGAALLLLAWSQATAQPLSLPPPPPDAGLEQRLNAPLPADLPLVDSNGAPLQLGQAFGARPALLVLGYYHCTQLCGLVMHGLLEALHDSRLPRSAYRVLRVSIDPADTPAVARAQRAADLAYADFLDPPAPAAAPLDLRLLTGTEAALHTLAQALGWRYQATGGPDGTAGAFAHPAVVAVLTPDGRVSRYLPGVRFEPAELRQALQDAAAGRSGGLSERLALLCAHFDPRLGRHSAAVLGAARAVGLLTVLALLAWVAGPAWRRRRKP